MRSVAVEREEGDDRDVVSATSSAIDYLLRTLASPQVVVVRVKNWFDSKWLGFSGIGRVPFESPIPDDPAVALAEFRQDGVTFPPFTPSRVLAESHWARTESGYEMQSDAEPIHPDLRHRSARNLQRRVSDWADDAVYLWYSSNSSSNGRASLMVYVCSTGVVSGFYVAMKKVHDAWTVASVSGSLPGQLRSVVETTLRGGAT